MTRSRRIALSLTPDELANVQSALEHYIEYLANYGDKDFDPEDDVPEIIESAESALATINETGARFFNETSSL